MENMRGEKNKNYVSLQTETLYNVPIYRRFFQLNGCKIMPPPDNWREPMPTIAGELFVNNVPELMSEQMLLHLFERFGFVYEMRLPIKFNGNNRGVAYIKFQHSHEADCAVYVLGHYFLSNGELLRVTHSHDKCRLFITDVPRYLRESEIEEEVRLLFPNVLRVYTHPYRYSSDYRTAPDNSKYALTPAASFAENSEEAIANHENNWQAVGYNRDNDRRQWRNNGYAFLHFSTHRDAMLAKRVAIKNTNAVRLWGRDVHIVCSNVDREKCPPLLVNNRVVENRSIFIRQVDTDVRNGELFHVISAVVPREAIVGFRRILSMVFIDFSTRGAAEKVLMHLQCMPLGSRRLHLQWAKQKHHRVMETISKMDFSVHLRLKCIANYWAEPVIIFGTYHALLNKQCVTIMLRNGERVVRYVICVIDIGHVNDIHSRACEVVDALLEDCGGFPKCNYIFNVNKEAANLVGTIALVQCTIIYTPAAESNGWQQLVCLALVEEFGLMCWSAEVLAPYSSADTLLQHFNDSFATEMCMTYLPNIYVGAHYKFGTLSKLPPHNYRRMSFLKHDLNNEEIVLVLCSKFSGTNLPYHSFVAAALAAHVKFMFNYDNMPEFFSLMLQPRQESSLTHVIYGQAHYSTDIVQDNSVSYNQEPQLSHIMVTQIQ